MLDQVFSTGGTLAKSGALSNGYWCLNAIKKIKKYIEKRVYLALQRAFYCLIVVQHQNNVENLNVLDNTGVLQCIIYLLISRMFHPRQCIIHLLISRMFHPRQCIIHILISRMFHPRQCIIHILISRMSHPRQCNSTQQNSSYSHCAVTGQWRCSDYPLTY